MNTKALVIAMAVGLVLQVAMVGMGHQMPALKAFFGLGGMTISLVAGVLFVWLAGAGTWATAISGGAIAGGVTALAGIALSYFLGDVPATLLVLGSLASAVAGAVGGAVVKFFV